MAKAKKPAATNSKQKVTENQKAQTGADTPVVEGQPPASKAAAAKPTPTTSSKPASDKVSLPKVERVAKPVTTKPSTPTSGIPKTTSTPRDKPVTAMEAKTETIADRASRTDDKPLRETASVVTPAPVQQERRSTFMPLVLGGLVAGALGFAAAEYNWFSTRAQDDGLNATVSQQGDRLTALESAEPVAPDVDFPALDELTTNVAGLSEALTDIEARLAIVEERPAPDGGTSVAENTAFEQELQALKASAEEQRAEIATLLSNAQSVEEATAAAAKSAQIQSAVSQITTAIGAGQPFDDTIEMLSENGITDMPAALTDVAGEGVVSLSNLQARFPDTARAALGVARTSGAMEGETGVGGFFKRQLGARSTAPREGADPDAVLSRAEAAMQDGGLDAALSEIDTLPEDVQSAMQDWLDDAHARNAAQLATQDLSQSLTAN